MSMSQVRCHGRTFSISSKEDVLTGCGIWEHWNLDKNAVPKVVRPLNGVSAWTATVFPGILLSSGPDCTYKHQNQIWSLNTNHRFVCLVEIKDTGERSVYHNNDESVCCRFRSNMSSCKTKIAYYCIDEAFWQREVKRDSITCLGSYSEAYVWWKLSFP